MFTHIITINMDDFIIVTRDKIDEIAKQLIDFALEIDKVDLMYTVDNSGVYALFRSIIYDGDDFYYVFCVEAFDMYAKSKLTEDRAISRLTNMLLDITRSKESLKLTEEHNDVVRWDDVEKVFEVCTYYLMDVLSLS